MLISDWSSDVCSSDLEGAQPCRGLDRANIVACRRRAPCHPYISDIPRRYHCRRRRPSSTRKYALAPPPLARKRVLGRVQVHRMKLCRSEEHTYELQSLMRISYAVFCLKKKKTKHNNQ